VAEVRTIPAQAFAAAREIRVSAVLSRIRSGIYEGVEVGGEWHVVRGGTQSSRWASRRRATSASTRQLAVVERVASVIGWGLLTLAGLGIWSTIPRPFYLSRPEAARQIEAVVGFDVPRDLRVVETYDLGFSPGDVYYHFVVELAPDAQTLFDQRWKTRHGDAPSACDPCAQGHSTTVTPLDLNRVRLDYAHD